MLELRAADKSGCRRALLIQEIFAEFDPWARYIAEIVWRRASRIGGNHGLADIVSAGRVALLGAIERWDQAFQKPLCHLAAVWIKWSCRAEANRLREGVVSYPASVRLLANRYRELFEHQDPTSADEYLRVARTSDRLRSIVRQNALTFGSGCLSLDRPLTTDDDSGLNLHDCLRDPSSDRDNFENQDLIALVRQIASEKMRPRHRLVLHLKYPGILDAEELSSVHALSEGRNTFSAIGRYLGVSRERARQKKWRPHGDSNPGSHRERVVS
jgi:RNA polymerase sigma factor (sigma-70 family)